MPDQAIDGNSSTRWSSGQWMQNGGAAAGSPLTWARRININEVRLNWETAYAANYQIQVSNDGLNWAAIDVVSGNQSRAIGLFGSLGQRPLCP